MSFAEDLLIILSGYHTGYRLIRRRLAGRSGIPRGGLFLIGERKIAGQTLRVTLSRLKEKGFIQNKERGVWKITARGMDRVAVRAAIRRARRESARKMKNLIVAFDIPEREAKKRQWLRMELQGLGFEMLQESLWFGPSPLPHHIVDGMRTFDLFKYVKFFRAQAADIV